DCRCRRGITVRLFRDTATPLGLKLHWFSVDYARGHIEGCRGWKGAIRKALIPLELRPAGRNIDEHFHRSRCEPVVTPGLAGAYAARALAPNGNAVALNSRTGTELCDFVGHRHPRCGSCLQLYDQVVLEHLTARIGKRYCLLPFRDI